LVHTVAKGILSISVILAFWQILNDSYITCSWSLIPSSHEKIKKSIACISSKDNRIELE